MIINIKSSFDILFEQKIAPNVPRERRLVQQAIDQVDTQTAG